MILDRESKESVEYFLSVLRAKPENIQYIWTTDLIHHISVATAANVLTFQERQELIQSVARDYVCTFYEK